MGIMNLLLFLLFFVLFSVMQCPTLALKRSYVVYLGGHSHGSQHTSEMDLNRITDSHHDLLGSCLGSKEKAQESIFYSYTHHINGFAANLEDEEAAELSKRPGVVSIFLNQKHKLQTTRSWEFLGLERNGEIPADSIWVKARFGEDIIIGNIDSGVWPESESFNDQGMGPIPSKWKGYCEPNDDVKCNRKLIGARYFNKGVEAELGSPLNSSYQTVRDTSGHGTHTLSTAGGRFVGGANLLGSGYGTAKGGSPSARVASYKSCWPDCNDVDVLAAIDAAIHDGVHILSLSIAFVSRDYFLDSIAVGSLHAVQNGIVVVCAGGNEGPTPGSVKNMAPWIITVAASTIDRDFPSNVTLGNNQQFKGRSFYTNSLPAEKFYPLVYSVDARAANASASDAQVCSVGSLDPKKVKGKIVYCLVGVNENVEKSWAVAQAGGIGMILSDRLSTDTSFSEPHFVPTSPVSAFDGLSILLYIHTTKYPVAYISGATEVGTVAAPIMPSFSSQGPNPITPEILKPDLTAPGVQIVAAYSEATGPTDLQSDDRRVPFSIISGTSMSCPHVAGTIGLLKKIHPDWSPSALRSAIMTTARTRTNVRQPLVNETLGEASPFSYGAGHLWPSRAMDPGLVYDLTTTDYLNFLCSIGYNATQLSTFVDKGYECPSKPMSLLDLNYPSITVPSLSGKVTVTRTLKNVGTPATYTVRTEVPSGISVKVEPNTLKFEKINEEKTFKVTLEAKRDGEGGEYVFGRLIWSDGEHYVRSPIVVNATTL
ncbi:subtilisin-like protease SBT5.3 isoform X2 [Vitis riparia]|uniref:subtilisin-like protease SBT5.3 isoform X2 n=1 Tax=Vitis riparia TaxID=96939 RepID=UPI00155AECB4|nr:subtilisin-like protease SBT5.3 isoform X2 [Vitis riparia]